MSRQRPDEAQLLLGRTTERTIRQSSRRSVDLRRCGPWYQIDCTSLRRTYRRSSSPSRRSGNFLKRHWHSDGDVQSANGSIGAVAARIFWPASSCTAEQHSRAATIVTAAYLAEPMVRRVFLRGREKSVMRTGKIQPASRRFTSSAASLMSRTTQTDDPCVTCFTHRMASKGSVSDDLQLVR
jgi:hypothetical protein